MTQKTRIITVVNKYWECDPVCWVLTNKYTKDNEKEYNLDFSNVQNLITYPSYGPVKATIAKDTLPRIVYETDSRIIEIWCISDLLANSAEELQSSSEEKMNLLPIVFNYRYKNMDCPIELVIAVGTASAGPSLAINPTCKADNINGSVVIGSKVFMHNGWDPDSKSNYKCNCWSEILSSSYTGFSTIKLKSTPDDIKGLLLCPPINPAPLGQQFYINENYIALGDVNVTDYTKYTEKDTETGQDFFAHYFGNVDGLSLETTHCLIYLSAKNYMGGKNPPFMFISGVVDRYTMFATDVSPKPYAQNVTGAHNAGVAVACILSEFIN